MHVSRDAGGLRRRVATVYEADGRGAHRLMFGWDPPTDAFRQTAEVRDAQGLDRYTEFIGQLVADGDPEVQSVRRQVLAFYGAGGLSAYPLSAES
jgi:hypothetical protein